MRPNYHHNGQHTITLENWFEFGVARDTLSRFEDEVPVFAEDRQRIDTARDTSETTITLSPESSRATVDAFLVAAKEDPTAEIVLRSFFRRKNNPFELSEI